MDTKKQQEQPLSTTELIFLTLSMGSVLVSVHFLLNAAF